MPYSPTPRPTPVAGARRGTPTSPRLRRTSSSSRSPIPTSGSGRSAGTTRNNGEISDICEDDPSGFSGVIEGYTVVSNWSNEAHSCVLSGLPRTISVGGGAILEGDSNTRTLQIPVTLSQPSHFTVTVHYSLQSVTARGASSAATGVDFLTKSGTVIFKPVVEHRV